MSSFIESRWMITHSGFCGAEAVGATVPDCEYIWKASEDPRCAPITACFASGAELWEQLHAISDACGG